MKYLKYDFSEDYRLYEDTIDNFGFEYQSKPRLLIRELFTEELWCYDNLQITIQLVSDYNHQEDNLHFNVKTYTVKAKSESDNMEMAYLVRFNVAYYREEVTVYAYQL